MNENALRQHIESAWSDRSLIQTEEVRGAVAEVMAQLDRGTLRVAHPEAEVNTVDGVKFDLEEGWVHLRKSNTEPIIRVYAEASSPEAASALGDRFKNELQGFLRALED